MKNKTIPQLKKTLWRLISKYVRQSQAKDGLVQCYTCGAVDHYKNMDLGHYWGRQFGATYFDVKRNLRIQCRRCNRFMEGNKPSFANRLIVELGQKGMEKLEIDAKSKYKFNRYTLEQKIKEYKSKLKRSK